MDIRSVIMGLSFALMWSSAFTSARIIVLAAPPISILALRFLIAGIIAIVLAFIFGQRAKYSAKQWRSIFIFGVCQNAIYLGLFFVAMARIEASLASIIASTMPLLVGLALVILLNEKLPLMGLIGLFIGFFGAFIILYARFNGGVDLLGIAFCAIGVIALTIATLTLKSVSTGENLFMAVGLQMLVGAIVLLPFAIYLETWGVNWSPKLVLAFSYTIFVPGILATYIWFKLVNRIGATKAAAFHFLNPFFGVAIAATFLGEQLTIPDMIGVVVIMVGIFAVQQSRIKT